MQRNARIAILCAVLALGMVGAAYAAVPLYRLFCQVTGFDGTVRRAEAAPARTLDRTMTVRFDTNVRDLDFEFRPEVNFQEVRIGETALAFFKVTNRSDRAVTAQAVYNVVPETAGAYFQKLECFCFSEQTIGPGQTVEFPMTYFIDPELASDPATKRMREITLSYTFYPVAKPAAQAAVSATPALGGRAAQGL